MSIGQAAKELGVSRETLRRWETAGWIEAERTPAYDLAKLDVLKHTAFSARLYGSRSHKNRQLVETLREVAENL